MTRTTFTERTASVSGRSIFYTETGSGTAVVMLHGGGPGPRASPTSRNIDVLAESHRVIVPDMPGYGKSDKHIDHSDPFGYLANSIRVCSMNWESRQHISSGTLRRRSCAAPSAGQPAAGGQGLS